MMSISVIYRVLRMFFAVWALLAAALFANPRDPFPIGGAMMSQGAIVETEGALGRSPWGPAALYRDTLRWGASMAAVSYHGGGSAARYGVGGFAVAGPVIGKLSLTRLDVMGLYYEQTAFLSAGSRWRFLSFSLEGEAYFTGLTGSVPDVPVRSRASAAVGATVLAQTKRLSVDLSAGGITVLPSGDGAADPALSVTARVCTARGRYGSQGAMVRITPAEASPLRFILAQEYRIGGMFALSASIASNPTMIGFGLSVDKSPHTGSAAAVNHPFLGWSTGVSAGCAK